VVVLKMRAEWPRERRGGVMAIDDGGAAFPRSPVRLVNSSGDVSWFDEQDGMSLRDYFAGQALAGSMNYAGKTLTDERFALRCYEIADAMLKARGSE
jgi:hypothetical protein